MINRIFGLILGLVISVVYVNKNPSLFGTEIELMIILSGMLGAFANSVYILPSFGGLVMTIFRGGLLLCNMLSCVASAYLMKNRVNCCVPLIGGGVFLLKSLVTGNFNFLYVFINTLIFSLVYFCIALIIMRHTKYIF